MPLLTITKVSVSIEKETLMKQSEASVKLLSLSLVKQTSITIEALHLERRETSRMLLKITLQLFRLIPHILKPFTTELSAGTR
jgi:hypothetical protein